MSHTLEKGVGDGFVFAPFDNPAKGIYTIPDGECPEGYEFTPADTAIPQSTSREDHAREVESIIESLAGEDGKIVAARVIHLDTAIDLNATFSALDKAYPDAFVFMFSTSLHGTWIGATPELLLKSVGNNLYTMALAGTRPAGTGGRWDEKNLREQRLVTLFIVSCLNKYCSIVRADKSFDKKAGTVEHICTPIEGDLTPLPRFSPVTWEKRIRNLICDLSPTPAVCGSDRGNALELIRTKEHFPRELYGGFCGPCQTTAKMAEIYVNLRSAKCSPDAVAVYAGGGITPLSDPDEEWNETELKSKTIISNLISHK